MRRVDLWPDDWLAGIGNLSLAARGVYLTACLLIYSRGGPIRRDHLRRLCPARNRSFVPALDELLGAGKLQSLDGDMLDQRRCEIEIERAKARIAGAQSGAAKRWNAEPTSGHTSATTQPAKRHLAAANPNEIIERPDASLAESKSNKLYINNNNTLGCAYAREGALGEPAAAPERTDEDKAHVDRIVAETLAVLSLPANGLRNGVYNDGAYREAISAHKRDVWLNNLAVFVGEIFDDLPKRMAAWEMIEQARAAGSRAATDPAINRMLDDFSRLRETALAQAAAAN